VGIVEELVEIWPNEVCDKFSQELPRKFIAKLLYGWGKKKYEREREKR